MKRFITMIFLTVSLLTGASLFGAQLSVGIRIGQPPPPRVVRVVPARPGRDFVWVEGYWYPVGNHWKWHKGYWTRAPFAGAHWVVPHYQSGEFFEGYWEGDHGRLQHDHHWDKDRERDYRDRDRDHDRR
jgi:WXXGXW repeat (2 copies)